MKRIILVIFCAMLLTAPACGILPLANLPTEVCQAIAWQHVGLSIIGEDYIDLTMKAYEGEERERRLRLLFNVLRLSQELFDFALEHGLVIEEPGAVEKPLSPSK